MEWREVQRVGQLGCGVWGQLVGEEFRVDAVHG